MTIESDIANVLDRVEWDRLCRGGRKPETVEMTKQEFLAFFISAPMSGALPSVGQPGSLMGIPIKIVENEQ